MERWIFVLVVGGFRGWNFVFGDCLSFWGFFWFWVSGV
jgi:hypothetical protein